MITDSIRAKLTPCKIYFFVEDNFVPAHNTDVFEPGKDVEVEEDDEDDKSIQQELVEDLSEGSATDVEENERMFSNFP